MRIAYDNQSLSASAVTALTEDAVFVAANLQNQRLAKVYRTTTPTAQTVVFDFGSAKTINCAAVLNHNYNASGVTTIEGHASDSWASPSVQTTITTIVGGVCLHYFTGGSFRYWRFTLDNDSNADGYVEAGMLWLSDFIDLDPTSMNRFKVTKHREDTVTYGRGRQKYATEGIGWRSFDLSFPRTGATALTNILTMIDTVGNHSSIVFSNFNTVRDYTLVEPVYCSVAGDLDFKHQRSMKFDYSLTLEEDR